MKEEALRRRLQISLYSIYDDYLDEKSKKRFDMVKDNDPYLNQVVEEVLDYLVYELPLEEIVIGKLRGEKNAKYWTSNKVLWE